MNAIKAKYPQLQYQIPVGEEDKSAGSQARERPCTPIIEMNLMKTLLPRMPGKWRKTQTHLTTTTRRGPKIFGG